jgi:C1A family cysteine protease
MEALKSPDDSRDWIAESIYPAKDELNLPKELDLRKDLQPVRSQGKQGTCAAQTAACMKEWQEKKDVGLNEYFSPQFIYNNRGNYPNSGMHGRDVMKILKNIGCCREMYFPYGVDKDKNTTSPKAIKDAAKYKIKSYALVSTIDGLKKALYKNGPCYISFPTYPDAGDTFWKPKNPTDQRKGGHAVTVVGYNKKGFLLRNSWSSKWGNNGYVIFPYEDFGMQWEIWSTIDEKSSEPDDKLRGSCIKFLTCVGENS